MKVSIKLFLLIILVNNNYAQGKLFLGSGLSICRDQFEVSDPGNKLEADLRPTTFILSFDIRRKINENWFIESGLFVKTVREGFGFNGLGYTSSNAIPNIYVPLRVAPKIEILKNTLYCNPLLGISLGYNSNYGSVGYGAGSFGIVQADTINYVYFKYDDDYNYSKVFFLFQIGLSFEFVFNNNSKIILQSNYYNSQQKLFQKNISYQIYKGPIIQASIASNGSFWQVLGITYLFSTRKKQSKQTNK